MDAPHVVSGSRKTLQSAGVCLMDAPHVVSGSPLPATEVDRRKDREGWLGYGSEVEVSVPG
jgi:hypothetical protein